ncbi:Retrovirus-related Pol polyprotein from transposon TNT 1-94 [Cucumis melo var. makuwa]|uniref:Retrovirus-related Pol polyprotein from transposon TNT 1-94 n=1 Tax=Cucumis melo var. makuwa TaxID=1194695 RepID=A0A5D3CH97_CUCMM|nr:Retrovirus-related Pol polyprotein from transposon TNT 1-94 [Cucumis melo var. makuwa]
MSSTSSLLGVENTEASSPINQIFGSGNKISLVKLNDDTFLLWKFQILTALEAYDLENFLESESEPPSKYLISTESSSASATGTPNPAYKVWKRQDRLISSWLLGSMSEEILNQMLHCKSAKEIWETLQGIFSSRYLAQAMQFKNKLHNIKKGSMPLKEYFLKILQCVDALASINKPVSSDDHILYILAGLGSDYQSMISVISARTDSPSVQEVMSLLLTQESQNESKLISETALPSVNIVTQTTEKGAESYIRTNQNNYHNNHSYNQRGGRGNGRSNRGRRGNRNKPQCQICAKLGYSADRCFFRYTPRSNSSGYSPNSHNTSYTNMNNHPQMSAMVAALDLNIDSNWYPDSGATNHLTHSLSNLSIGSEYGGGNQIYAANGSGLPITHYGSMSFNSSTLPFKSFTLNNLLQVPSITKNLISVSQFAKDNHVFFEFHPTLCYVKDLDTGQVLLQGLLNDGLYKFTIEPSHKRLHHSNSNTKPVFNTVVPKSNTPLLDLWHRRLGHPHLPIVKAVLNHIDNSSGTINKLNFCEACALGKHHALPFSHSLTLYTHPLQLITCDLWGPAVNVSHNGFRYYISFVDAYSRYTWIYFLNSKSDAFLAFQKFKTCVEKSLGQSIKSLQTDGGTEFKPFKPFLDQHGIEHRITCPYTSKQNDIVERKHRYIMEMGLTLLSQATLPLSFWDEAFSTSVYLINRLPTPVLDNISPLEKLFCRKPNFPSLRVFGCKCYPYLRPYQSHKLSLRSTPCTFLGYSTSHKGYKCLASDGRLFISRHVLFDENSFPYASFASHSSIPKSKDVLSPPLHSIIPSSLMNHNEDRRHTDTVSDNTDHLNPTIVYPLETGTQESSRDDGNSGGITQSPSSMEPSHQTDSGMNTQLQSTSIHPMITQSKLVFLNQKYS